MTTTEMQSGASLPIIVEVRRMSDGLPETGLGSATNLKLRLRSPSGVSSIKDATLYTDGSDAKITWPTGGIIIEVGTWLAQPQFALGSFSGPAKDISFSVKGNV